LEKQDKTTQPCTHVPTHQKSTEEMHGDFWHLCCLPLAAPYDPLLEHTPEKETQRYTDRDRETKTEQKKYREKERERKRGVRHGPSENKDKTTKPFTHIHTRQEHSEATLGFIVYT